MATEQQQENEVEQGEQILVRGELRPKNRFFIAVSEQAAKNKASGLPDPYPWKPLDVEIEGEPLSHTIIRDRGEY